MQRLAAIACGTACCVLVLTLVLAPTLGSWRTTSVTHVDHVHRHPHDVRHHHHRHHHRSHDDDDDDSSLLVPTRRPSLHPSVSTTAPSAQTPPPLPVSTSPTRSPTASPPSRSPTNAPTARSTVATIPVAPAELGHFSVYGTPVTSVCMDASGDYVVVLFSAMEGALSVYHYNVGPNTYTQQSITPDIPGPYAATISGNGQVLVIVSSVIDQVVIYTRATTETTFASPWFVGTYNAVVGAAVATSYTGDDIIIGHSSYYNLYRRTMSTPSWVPVSTNAAYDCTSVSMSGDGLVYVVSGDGLAASSGVPAIVRTRTTDPFGPERTATLASSPVMAFDMPPGPGSSSQFWLGVAYPHGAVPQSASHIGTVLSTPSTTSNFTLDTIASTTGQLGSIDIGVSVAVSNPVITTSAIGIDRPALLVGQPNAGTAGRVFLYAFDNIADYLPVREWTSTIPGFTRFGHSVAVSGNGLVSAVASSNHADVFRVPPGTPFV